MLTFDYTVEEPEGMHARTAGLFVREAVKHPCAVRVDWKGRSTDGKSLLGIMGLRAPHGAKLTIRLDGESEDVEEEARRGLLEALKEGSAGTKQS